MVEGEQDGKQNQGDYIAYDYHGQARFHVVVEVVPAGGKDHHVGRHADGSSKGQGAADNRSYDNSFGVSAHSSGDVQADGNQEGP